MRSPIGSVLLREANGDSFSLLVRFERVYQPHRDVPFCFAVRAASGLYSARGILTAHGSVALPLTQSWRTHDTTQFERGKKISLGPVTLGNNSYVIPRLSGRMDAKVIGLGVVLAVAGLGLLLVSGGSIYEAYQATSSAEDVDAVVIESEVESKTDPDDSGNRTYFPNVTYEYEYDGERYTSHNYNPGSLERGMSSSDARSVARQYRSDDTVTAHVPPDNPSEAYLRGSVITVIKESIGSVGTAIVLLILGIATVVSQLLGFKFPFALDGGDENGES